MAQASIVYRTSRINAYLEEQVKGTYDEGFEWPITKYEHKTVDPTELDDFERVEVEENNFKLKLKMDIEVSILQTILDYQGPKLQSFE